MKKAICLAMAASLFMLSGLTQARNTLGEFDIEKALQSKGSENLLKVKLYFGETKVPGVEKRLYENVTTSQKSNAFGRSDEVACNRALLNAVIALQKRAQREGANAVVNIRSNYRHNEFTSTTQFQCGAGGVIAGVALKADIVKLKD